MSDFVGITELMDDLEEILEVTEDPVPILTVGAEAFVKDLMKLPKPRSRIRSSRHTHLVDTFAYQESPYRKGEVEVGWGKYYGRMVEKGTVRMGRQPHLEPTFNRNKENYYKKMLKKAKLI